MTADPGGVEAELGGTVRPAAVVRNTVAEHYFTGRWHWSHDRPDLDMSLGATSMWPSIHWGTSCGGVGYEFHQSSGPITRGRYDANGHWQSGPMLRQSTFVVQSFRSVTQVVVPFWMPTATALLLPGLRALNALRLRRLPPGHCRRCGYDLRASPDRCPECGRAANPGGAGG